jgi:transposase InsO family protein
LIVLELAVDHVGQAAFQAAQRFVVALPSLAFAQVVGAALGEAACLGDRHDVQRVVERAVAGSGQPVSSGVSGGDVDRCGAAVGGEVGIHRTVYPTRAHARADIARYIEFWYNRNRLHSGLDYKSPQEVLNEWTQYQQAA